MEESLGYSWKWFCLCEKKIKETSKSIFVYSPIDMMQSTTCENLRWTNLEGGGEREGGREREKKKATAKIYNCKLVTEYFVF